MATKRMTEAQDEAMDVKQGVKEGSAKDMRMDAASGVQDVKKVSHGHVNKITPPQQDSAGAVGGPRAGGMNRPGKPGPVTKKSRGD